MKSDIFKWSALTFLCAWPILAIKNAPLYAVSIALYELTALYALFKRSEGATQRNGAAVIVLAIALVSAFIADTIYSYSVVSGGDIAALVVVQEVAYLFFAALMVVYVWQRFVVSSGKTTLALAIMLGIFHGLLSYKLILHPFYLRANEPNIFHKVVSTGYAYSISILFGLLLVSTGRVGSSTHYVFLQSMLLLINADFALRSQFTLESKSIFTWVEPCWAMAFGGMLWCILFDKKFTHRLVDALVAADSIRARMAQMFLGAVALITSGLYGLNIVRIEGVFDLTVVLLWFYIVWLMANSFSMYFSSRIEKIREVFMLSGSLQQGPALSGVREIDEILQAHHESIKRAVELESRLVKSELDASRVAQAQQVAHDIRSPLTVLGLLEDETTLLPEHTRIMFRTAIQRIRDIANDLLRKNLPSPDPNASALADALSDEDVASLLDSLISEVRTQFRSKLGVQIELKVDPSAYGSFVRVVQAHMKRALTNLLVNAVESIEKAGHVHVNLAASDGKVILTITDNGRGISKISLQNLGTRGFTEGKVGGSGFGFSSAKEKIEGWSGSIVVQSKVGGGTTITIELPQAKPPAWFHTHLEIHEGAEVVIIDDDSTIHQVWQARFEPLLKKHNLKMLHFSRFHELENWLKENPARKTGSFFLSDYEILGTRQNGLETIRLLGLQSNAALVTSHYQDQKIQALCCQHGIKMIPKNTAVIIPITFNSTPPKAAREEAALIDDDALIHMVWKNAAAKAAVTLYTYVGIDDFLSHSPPHPKGIAIYIDSNLGAGLRGEHLSEILYRRGYQNIILATGYEPDTVDKPEWIKSIQGKEPPWS